MPLSRSTILRRIVGSAVLLATVAGVALALFLVKRGQEAAAAAQAAAMPEFAMSVESAEVGLADYTRSSTAIGTARALRSITLRNELPGTVRSVQLETGAIVAEGELLVELDVAVEEAQLAAQKAEARLAETMLGRMERALERQGASAADVDRARAERDMANANVARLEAIIEQKRLRAPFEARVGMVDLHVGQYLEPGTQITTLQGVSPSVHIDFNVTQDVAARLAVGGSIEVVVTKGAPTCIAEIVAIDARVDSMTRNTWIRAELRGAEQMPQPGASVRVRTPIAAPRKVPVVPVSALRRGPGGSSVFVLLPDDAGQLRAYARRVTSGAMLGDVVVIEEGLEVGELIAAAGSFKLQEGMLVAVTNQAAAAVGN